MSARLVGQTSAPTAQHHIIDTNDVSPLIALPVHLTPRVLGQVPRVDDTGVFSSVSGSPIAAPVTGQFAVADLLTYDAQLASAFPMSQARFPADSINAVLRDRAQHWLSRVQRMGNRVTDTDFVALAVTAFRAGDDSLAVQWFDRRLRTLSDAERKGQSLASEHVVARAVVLLAAIQTLTWAAQDSVRLARNLPVAVAYGRQLLALPGKGYRTVADSADVLYHQYDGVVALIRALSIQRDVDVLTRHVGYLIAQLSKLGLWERQNELSNSVPYREIAAALADTGAAARWRDSLDATLLTLARGRDAEWSTMGSATQREAQRQEFVRDIHDMLDRYHRIGHPAEAVVAHAYLNTADSSYNVVPRIRSFGDGFVYVLAMGPRTDPRLDALQRLQDAFPRTVRAIFLTKTEGHASVDLLSPPDEVTWLARYYRGNRHLTIPIAVWAGPKIPGTERSLIPQESPMTDVYGMARLNVLIIDARGTLRAYEPLQSHTDEARIVRRLQYIIGAAARLHD